MQVEYIQYIKAIPSEEGKQAELALFRRHPDEAERILLQASPPLVYRAIKLNLKHRQAGDQPRRLAQQVQDSQCFGQCSGLTAGLELQHRRPLRKGFQLSGIAAIQHITGERA